MSDMHLFTEQSLSGARIKETRDVQWLGWFPGPVVNPP